MHDYLNNIKPAVRALKPYSLAVNEAPIKLNQNENPFDLPRAIREEGLRRFTGGDWARYPDFVPVDLLEKLAAHVNWTSDGIIAGNGSNEIINAVFMATISCGEKVLLSEPTFAIYRQGATVLDAEVLSVPLTSDFKHDVPAIKRAIEGHQPVVTVICSPNNPTGTIITEDELKSLLEVARGFIILDEAYWEFAGHTFVPMLREHKNLIVMRTFSKALGMASLRVGFMMASPEIAREVRKAVLPYNINRFSQTVAEVAIEMYEAELAPLVAKIINERERMFAEINRIEGIKLLATHANFFLAHTGKLAPTELYNQLYARGILIRDVSKQPMLENFVRISVGTPDETDELITALKEIYETVNRKAIGFQRA